MMHPKTRLAVISDAVGFGVVATEPIPRGTIVWVRDRLDLRIPRSEARALGEPYRDALRHYTFWEPDGDLVLCWDHARYVNHSCEATCLGGGYEFQLAVRDIAAGEEVTDDYGSFGYANAFACACGTPNCRSYVSCADATFMAPVWDELLMRAMVELPDVPQPLWGLVRDKAAAIRASRDPAAIQGHRIVA